MRGKQGWMRIMEAVLAILILSSILIILYINNVPQKSYSESIYPTQANIIAEISSREDLRNAVLSENETILDNFIKDRIYSQFNFDLVICNIDAQCSLVGEVDKEVYAVDTIISGNLTTYSPKIVRLFVWEK